MPQEADHPVFIGVFMVFQWVRESHGRRFTKPLLYQLSYASNKKIMKVIIPKVTVRD
jgi:hypothetical protein